MTPTLECNHLTALLRQCAAALEACTQHPDDAVHWRTLVEARRQAMETVAQLPAENPALPEVAAARSLVHQIAASGVLDRPSEAADLELAERLALCGWPGLLAAMGLVSAYQSPNLPGVFQAPAWLRPDWITYLFHAPQGFSALGQADAYAAHYLSRLEELAHFVHELPATDAQSLAKAFLGACNCIPLYFNDLSLRRHYELRGHLFALANGVGADDFDATPRSRVGRRLRVGFVNLHFGPQTETYTTLPMFQQLDPERFEVLLFVRRAGDSQVEQFARKRVAAFHVLPADLDGQRKLLRDASLDVVVLGTNTTAVFNEVTRLALRRIAPLQIVNNSSCTTSGLSSTDLYISGSLTEAADAASHYTERLALLPGPTHAFNYDCDRHPPSRQWTRAELGLPETATVFATAANYFKVIPEMRRTWAQLLADVPGSYLLVHPFNPNWSSSYPIGRFAHELKQALAASGVSPERLVLSVGRLPSRTDVRELLRVADVYLDTYPFGGVNSLVDPLENGTPVVTWEGATFRSRMGAALLRQLGLDALIADKEESYRQIARRLAEDSTLRATYRQRILKAMARPALFLDTLAAADAFAGLLEAAYDELERVGREAFRANSMPLAARLELSVDDALDQGTAAFAGGDIPAAFEHARSILAVEPAHPGARWLMGSALLAQGRAERAALYLLAALPSFSKDAGLWYQLALAFRAAGNLQDSFNAAQTCVRLDGHRQGAWLLLAELAETFSQSDLAAKLRAHATPT